MIFARERTGERARDTSKRKGRGNVAEVRGDRGAAEEPMDGRERCAGPLSLEDNGNK